VSFWDVLNSHYSVPNIPAIKNLSEFTGTVMHSRDYRIPDPFRNKRVVILGSGPSGVDISLEIVTVAKQVKCCTCTVVLL
jgi:cation diffusion facilitator CzcD-associated flavoprotein CzcO